MRSDIWSDVICHGCHLGSRRLRAALDRVGHDGIEHRFDRALRVNTAADHRLIAWAGATAGQGPLVDRLFDDHLTQGANLCDPAVLVAAAAAAGLDAEVAGEVLASGGYTEEIRADPDEARARGISGVPAFVVDDEWVIPGAQADRMVQLLGRVRERRGEGNRVVWPLGWSVWRSPRRSRRNSAAPNGTRQPGDRPRLRTAPPARP